VIAIEIAGMPLAALAKKKVTDETLIPPNQQGGSSLRKYMSWSEKRSKFSKAPCWERQEQARRAFAARALKRDQGNVKTSVALETKALRGRWS
jgi:hypothetical protein